MPTRSKIALALRSDPPVVGDSCYLSCFRSLLGQFGLELFLVCIHVIRKGRRVDEWIGTLTDLRKLFEKTPVVSMRTQENVGMQGSRKLVGAYVIIGPVGIFRIVDENTPACSETATNHDIVGSVSVLSLHRVRRAALRMSSCEYSREGNAAELHSISVVQYPVDRVWLFSGLNVSQRRNVLFHGHHLSTGQFLDPGVSFLVIRVSVTAKNDSNVVKFKTEFLDTSPYRRKLSFEATVDEDMARGRGDQIRGMLRLGTHKVNIPNDLEWFHQHVCRSIRFLSGQLCRTQDNEQ